MRSVAAFLALLLVLTACSACGPARGASGSSVVRSATTKPGSPETDVPETLAAATAAAQANIDRFTAGDFAGVWDHMDSAVRSGITKDDFVLFYKTCKKTGGQLSVTGIRLDPGDQATVLMTVRGVQRSRIMRYEDGQWTMQATDDFAGHLGQPVQQIIAEEKAAGLCTT